MNWKLRIKNRATLVALIAGAIPLIYLILGWFNITPKVSESDIIQAMTTIINLLVLLGVVVDPTTDGIDDSTLAMSYEEPRVEMVEREDDDRSDGEEAE